MENLHCQRNLTVGSLSVYLVNKVQFRLGLYFELFDSNFRFGSQKLHLAVKSNLGSLLWFHLSLSCQRSFFGQYTAKLSYLCKSCKGAKIALTPPPPPYNTILLGRNIRRMSLPRLTFLSRRVEQTQFDKLHI